MSDRERNRSRVGTGQKEVSSVLGAVLARHRLTGGVRRARALVAWPEVVGEALARTTRAATVRDGVLIVETQDAVAASFLTMQRPMFLERLRERLGEDAPADLRFQMGVFESPPAARAPEPPLPPPDRRRVEAMVENASDGLLPAARRAAEAVARARARRLARGWTPCPLCGAPDERPGPCQPCRELLASPHVRAVRLRLVRDPDAALGSPETLFPGATDEALTAARWLALEYLEARLESLLPKVARPSSKRRKREPEDETAEEHRLYLELAARAYLALKLARAFAEVDLERKADRAGLPERVRHVLEAGGRV